MEGRETRSVARARCTTQNQRPTGRAVKRRGRRSIPQQIYEGASTCPEKSRAARRIDSARFSRAHRDRKHRLTRGEVARHETPQLLVRGLLLRSLDHLSAAIQRELCSRDWAQSDRLTPIRVILIVAHPTEKKKSRNRSIARHVDNLTICDRAKRRSTTSSG